MDGSDPPIFPVPGRGYPAETTSQYSTLPPSWDGRHDYQEIRSLMTRQSEQELQELRLKWREAQKQVNATIRAVVYAKRSRDQAEKRLGLELRRLSESERRRDEIEAIGKAIAKRVTS
jgi:hypothetical protein